MKKVANVCYESLWTQKASKSIQIKQWKPMTAITNSKEIFALSFKADFVKRDATSLKIFCSHQTRKKFLICLFKQGAWWKLWFSCNRVPTLFPALCWMIGGICHRPVYIPSLLSDSLCPFIAVFLHKLLTQNIRSFSECPWRLGHSLLYRCIRLHAITFSQVHSGTCGCYSEMLSKSIIKYCNRGIS